MSTAFLKPATYATGRLADKSAASPLAESSTGSGRYGGRHGTGIELLIAEGKSAADALDQVRDKQRQGIFMMQGKIPNPETASPARLLQHEQCSALMELLGEGSGTSDYEQIVIVPDPDVDGRHAAMLLISLFRKYLSSWIDTHSLHLFRTPLARVDGNSQSNNDPAPDSATRSATNSATGSATKSCYLDTAAEVQQWLANRNAARSGITHYKGLAAFNPAELATLLAYPVHSNERSLCLNPEPTTPP